MEFNETQRFRPWWIWLAIAIVFIFPISAFLIHIVGDPVITYDPPSNPGLMVLAIIPFLLLLFFLSIRLEVHIDEQTIRYRFFPIHLKPCTLKWERVTQAKILETGWVRRAAGIRYLRGGNTLIGLASKAALSLHLDNGKKLMLGTRQPEEMDRLLEHLRSKGMLPLEQEK
jgi:hypothetical protein